MKLLPFLYLGLYRTRKIEDDGIKTAIYKLIILTTIVTSLPDQISISFHHKQKFINPPSARLGRKL